MKVSLATPFKEFTTQPKVMASLCIAHPSPSLTFRTTGFHSLPEKLMSRTNIEKYDIVRVTTASFRYEPLAHQNGVALSPFARLTHSAL